MKLYHGTSSVHLSEILKKGIVPRFMNDGNWEGDLASHPERVYLTNAYGFYFAGSAIKGKGEKMIVIEIDTDLLEQDRLRPDEDALEQIFRKKDGLSHLSLSERTKYYRDSTEFDHLWEESLIIIGNCSYQGTIDPSAFTRICVFDYHENPQFAFAVTDATISAMAYKFAGYKHKIFTEFAFGGDPDAFEEELWPGKKNSEMLPTDAGIEILKVSERG